jgi:Kef-type K+ transport system membrane component KefB
MNRIEFVGNAFFIPFFLISVGMLVDVSVLFKGFGAIKVAGVMIVMAVVTKFIAAWLTQKTFSLSAIERQLIFGLSNARVGATLAVVLVGYSIILSETPTGEPIRLLSEDVLNGTVLMILVTCTISSFITEKLLKSWP